MNADIKEEAQKSSISVLRVQQETNFAFWKDFRRLLGYYWCGKEKKWAIVMAIGIVLMILGAVGMMLFVNVWQRNIYNALQNYDSMAFGRLLLQFVWLALLVILLAVIKHFLETTLMLKWRAFLTKHYLRMWLQDKRYYVFSLLPNSSDNPDQRLAEDVDNVIGGTTLLTTHFFEAALMLLAFIGVLWTLSGTLKIPLGGLTLTIPGYLVFVALLYATIGTWVTARVARPLLKMDYAKEHREGDLRFALSRFREHGASIASLNGEAWEQRSVKGFIKALVLINQRIIIQMLFVNGWRSVYANAATVIPLIALAPRFFSEGLSLGFLMQVTGAFGHVRHSLSVVADSYTQIMALKASTLRLLHFEKHTKTCLKEKDVLTHATHTREGVMWTNLYLHTPEGALITKLSRGLLPKGVSTLITGASGIGKSTFLKALAGVWPFGKGQMMKPADETFCFVPQKPYIPLGTLRDAVCYPVCDSDLPSDEKIRAILHMVGLDAFENMLDAQKPWQHILSGGEAQRLSFARVLLQAPAWVLLDEATSALDTDSEEKLYHALKTHLPTATIISVGHRKTLEAFHTQRWPFGSGIVPCDAKGSL